MLRAAHFGGTHDKNIGGKKKTHADIFGAQVQRSENSQRYVPFPHARDSRSESPLQTIREQRRLIQHELAKLIPTKSGIVDEEIHLGHEVALEAQSQYLRIRDDYIAQIGTDQTQRCYEVVEFRSQIALAEP